MNINYILVAVEEESPFNPKYRGNPNTGKVAKALQEMPMVKGYTPINKLGGYTVTRGVWDLVNNLYNDIMAHSKTIAEANKEFSEKYPRLAKDPGNADL